MSEFKLPTDPAERKTLQLYTFMFEYFPRAWLEVVRIARIGNQQHNPGEPLHWARGKSTDQMNALMNHLFDYGLGEKADTDGGKHLAKLIWRAMAQLQLDEEADDTRRQSEGTSRHDVEVSGGVLSEARPERDGRAGS